MNDYTGYPGVARFRTAIELWGKLQREEAPLMQILREPCQLEFEFEPLREFKWHNWTKEDTQQAEEMLALRSIGKQLEFNLFCIYCKVVLEPLDVEGLPPNVEWYWCPLCEDRYTLYPLFRRF